MEEAWRGTAETTRAIVDLATNHGIPTRIVVLPAHYQVDESVLTQYVNVSGGTQLEFDITRPNRLLAEAAKVAEVKLTDATSVLAAAQKAGQQVHGRVDTHLSPTGHAIIADLLIPDLYETLRSRGSSTTSTTLE